MGRRKTRLLRSKPKRKEAEIEMLRKQLIKDYKGDKVAK